MCKKSWLFVSVLALGITVLSDAAYAQQATQPSSAENPAANQTSLEQQVKMLESAIVPSTPEETVATWAKAVKIRNGALQYALFTDNTKLGTRQTFEHFQWVTGVSSPWVETYEISSVQKESEQSSERSYLVEFDLVTSTGKAGKDQAVVTLVKQGEKWLINSISPASEKSIGIWNTPESVKELDIEKNLEEMETYESKLGYKIQLPKSVMSKISIEQATCENEEGNPPCTHYYYKDSLAKKNVLIMTAIRLSKEQEKSSYYQEHPFLKKIGENNQGAFYYMYPSEHQYAGKEDSEQGKEWNYLLQVLIERVSHITP